jgi:Mn-dependent DtxR family transcriptional regulator
MDMPRRPTERVEDRTLQIRSLLETYGCLTTTEINNALGLTHSQSYYVLEQLKNAGQAAKIMANKVAVWCKDQETANQLVESLKAEVKRLICANRRIKYVTPHKVVNLIMSDKVAKQLFAKYLYTSRRGVPLPATLAFIDYILRELLGAPVMRNSQTSIYFVNIC